MPSIKLKYDNTTRPIRFNSSNTFDLGTIMTEISSLSAEINKIKLRKTETKKQSYEILADKAYWDAQNDIHSILPNLFLTSAKGASDKDKLVAIGITHILIPATLGIQGVDILFPEAFEYVQFDLKDTPQENIIDKFDSTFEKMDTILGVETNKILVHCARGASRSASFVIGYMIHHKRMTYDEAYTHVVSIRPHVSPNEGFVKQLKEFSAKKDC